MELVIKTPTLMVYLLRYLFNLENHLTMFLGANLIMLHVKTKFKALLKQFYNQRSFSVSATLKYDH